MGRNHMELVEINIGSLRFDQANYDAENDVLYLHGGRSITRGGGGDTRGPRSALRAGYDSGGRADASRGARDA
jgi:hypothetical protein